VGKVTKLVPTEFAKGDVYWNVTEGSKRGKMVCGRKEHSPTEDLGGSHPYQRPCPRARGAVSKGGKAKLK